MGHFHPFPANKVQGRQATSRGNQLLQSLVVGHHHLVNDRHGEKAAVLRFLIHITKI